MPPLAVFRSSSRAGALRSRLRPKTSSAANTCVRFLASRAYRRRQADVLVGRSLTHQIATSWLILPLGEIIQAVSAPLLITRSIRRLFHRTSRRSSGTFSTRTHSDTRIGIHAQRRRFRPPHILHVLRSIQTRARANFPEIIFQRPLRVSQVYCHCCVSCTSARARAHPPNNAHATHILVLHFDFIIGRKMCVCIVYRNCMFPAVDIRARF